MSDYDTLADLCRLDRPTGNALIVGAIEEIKRLRQTLEWLLENDELTNYGQKTAREALGLKE